MTTPFLWPDALAVPEVGSLSAASSQHTIELRAIELLDGQLLNHFQEKLLISPALTRQMVSFQANKRKAGYRWYKFKEAFSASLIEYLLNQYRVNQGRVLDPFAGSGTVLFAASAFGLAADGIEVLPIGQMLIAVRKQLEAGLQDSDQKTIRRWAEKQVWEQTNDRLSLPELRITQGAYPAETKKSIEKYLAALTKESEAVQSLLRFALLCVIESISYTRKDGQYLRWDFRSNRKQGSKVFDKGQIPEFRQAITSKLEEILFDLQKLGWPTELFPTKNQTGELRLYEGSCLEILPSLPDISYDVMITSPPYCNRYDYTRTYALELALLGVGEKELIELRQQMLSCTVENRAKDLLKINSAWQSAIDVADSQKLLQEILSYLENQKQRGNLNNTGIPRMIRGYFYEMACVIAESARVLKSGAPLLMVNDNVRYSGASISVDLILSEMAEKLGFKVENILVLPGGKGNSSQQMGEHGRDALRKCVYVWRRI